ncbi:sulfatase-like hydrolase/transferase [Reinekea forsetii]|nr:sulfatase-like hydrolase/transferase [Reinekea forsetii]
MARKFKAYFGLLVLFVFVCSAIMAVNLATSSAAEGWFAKTYVPLAFISQAFAFSLLLAVILLPFLLLPTSFVITLYAILAGTTWLLLAVDAWVFSVYRFHINAFFIKMLFVDRAGMGVGNGILLVGFMAWLAFMGFTYWLANKSCVLFNRIRTGLVYSFLAVLLVIGQGIHAWGYAHNMGAIISLTHVIPWYTPLTATTKLKQLGWFNESLVEDNLVLKEGKVGGFNYPAEPIQCAEENTPNIIIVSIESLRFDRFTPEIMPNITEIGRESLYFSNHLSTGTVTDRGVFGLIYSLSPVFFNSAMGAGKQPALIESTQQLGYQHWVLANQDIEVNKLDTLLFNGIQPLQSQGKGAVNEGDANLIQQFKQQLENNSTEQPFFSFILFNGSHFPYWTPPNYPSPFTPAKQLRISKVNDDTEPKPYLNQYSNSIHYLDTLIGELKTALKANNQWENTIVVITGDHGEEFKDQNEPYWGHGSNFTQYQTQVPLIIHWPGKHQQVNYRTSHEDIAATLVTEALNCDVAFESISTGEPLFSNAPRVNIVASYVNQAIIVESSVNELLPGFVKSYSLESVDEKVETPAAAIKGVQKIYQYFR